MRHKNIFRFAAVLAAVFCFFSCSPAEEKTDEYYFQALRSIEDGNKEEAVQLFEKGIRNSSPEISRLCSLFLSEINKKKAVEIMKEALQKYPEDNAVNCRYMAVLYEGGKYDSLFEFSEKEKKTLGKDNEYIKFRLLALAKTGNTLFSEEFIRWMTTVKFTSYHIEFLDEWYKDSSYTEYKYYNEKFYENFQFLINMRRSVYQGNYSKAYTLYQNYSTVNGGELKVLNESTVPVLTDIGKACLFGSTRKYEDALLFSRNGMQVEGNDRKYEMFFYAGRLLDKAGEAYRNTALENFRTAYSLATDDLSRDKALWYYLDTARHISTEKAVVALNELSSSWSDPEYFDDFLNDLAADLMSAGNYDLLTRVFEKNKNYFSSISFSKYAYISGRMIEENLCDSISDARETYVMSLFNSAWAESRDNLYYRLLLADRLGKTEAEFYEDDGKILEEKGSVEEMISEGLLRYDLRERFFTYFKSNAKSISEEKAMDLIGRIEEAEKDNADRYPDILRLSTAVMNASPDRYRKDVMSFMYPRFFEELVSQKTEQYGVPEHLLYALMRSESYFDRDVYSSAGAIGLCQLMEETAVEIARKLKVKEYDLLDADTNMSFGSFYLNELTGRLDGRVIEAFMSYNCGITRVRRWREGNGTLPADIFIEMVPIVETRDYARKILTAGCLYGNIYYSMSFTEVIDELFQRQ